MAMDNHLAVFYIGICLLADGDTFSPGQAGGLIGYRIVPVNQAKVPWILIFCNFFLTGLVVLHRVVPVQVVLADIGYNGDVGMKVLDVF